MVECNVFSIINIPIVQSNFWSSVVPVAYEEWEVKYNISQWWEFILSPLVLTHKQPLQGTDLQMSQICIRLQEQKLVLYLF